MSVQYFEAEWLRCALVSGAQPAQVSPAVPAEHRGLCLELLTQRKTVRTANSSLGDFLLTFENVHYIDDFAASRWWREWVLEPALQTALPVPAPNDAPEKLPAQAPATKAGPMRPSPPPRVGAVSATKSARPRPKTAAKTPASGLAAKRPTPSARPAKAAKTGLKAAPRKIGRALLALEDAASAPPAPASPSAPPTPTPLPPLRRPDAVVLGAWIFHATFPAGDSSPSPETVLADYERRLRAFLAVLTKQPSYASYWAHGRIIWRAALPTEIGAEETHFERGQSVSRPSLRNATRAAEANAVAARAIRELAPGIRWLSQRRALRHEAQYRGGNASLVLTRDGIHFQPPVQVLLMRHLLHSVRRCRSPSPSPPSPRTTGRARRWRKLTLARLL